MAGRPEESESVDEKSWTINVQVYVLKTRIIEFRCVQFKYRHFVYKKHQSSSLDQGPWPGL